ncbi:phenylacetate--CoA ligase family protein [Nocardia sp. NPDC050175]|uniref:phenylacetate--CoA ligase family protein n=1 Tax=Nocardia sp. NPDC050175 TaxID=3364317 RepID=UPI0037B40429
MTALLSPEPGGEPGFVRALDIFRRAARDVPAYRAHLDRHGIDPDSVRTPADFARVDVVTKDGYLRRNPLGALVWHGDISEAGTWSSSSGSSGKPTYFPRDLMSLQESIEFYSRMLCQSFDSAGRSTLLVVGFAMGNWIGGTYTYQAVLELRRRGHRVSVVAPGIDAETILANIADLGPSYDQVVLAGYPPFAQDVLDRADKQVRAMNLGVLLAGENISEEWRDHILDRIGQPDRPDRTCLIYGTADAGVMGHETPTTIAIRRLARTDARLRRELFGDDDPALPTFVEYDPHLRYTETDEQGRFLFTVDSALPLVRYRINDEGTILTAWRVAAALRRCGYRIPVRTSTFGAGFLVLRRRSDVAASFYAVKLYPESIRAALEAAAVRELVTGKFVLATVSDAAFAQTLDLRVELRESVEPTGELVAQLRQLVTAALDRTNSEYRKLRTVLDAAAEPAITLVPFGSSGFRYSVKHTYLENNR